MNFTPPDTDIEPPPAKQLHVRPARFSFAINGLFILAVFYTLKFAADVFMPVTLALFLSFLLNPIVRWLRRRRWTVGWACGIAVAGFLTLLAALGAGVGGSLARFGPEFPEYIDHVQEKLQPLLKDMRSDNSATHRLDDLLESEKVAEVKLKGPSVLQSLISILPTFFANAVVVHVMAFFLLLYGEEFLAKLMDLSQSSEDQKNTEEIAAEIELTASRFFSSVTLINAGVGASVWIFVGLLGLPNAMLWGIAAFLLHYIPFVGAAGGIIAMAMISLVHFDSVWYALLPPLAYLFAAMVEGNVATPYFLGRWLTLNPLAIVLSFLLWAYVWGPVGMLLAVPILAVFKIFCDRIDTLKPLSKFLG